MLLPLSKPNPQSATAILDCSQTPILRATRPDWSIEWRNAKTGGVAIHRRHCVRSGLMKAALSATFQQAIKLEQLQPFYAAATRILKAEPFEVESLRTADLLLDALYSRLHNNHMNIFYGRGSFNQMLGTLAHGLEKHQPAFKAALQEAQSQTALQVLTHSWALDTLSYAMTEYMDLQQEQETQVAENLQQHFSSEFQFNASAFYHDLAKLELFADRPGEGPMEIKVHQDRHTALQPVIELMAARFEHLFTSVSSEADSPEVLAPLKEEIVAFAGDLLDSANLDISEASNDAIRRLQNSRAIATTQAFTQLLETPDLEQFETSATAFLALEAEAGALLELGDRYQNWFENDKHRLTFFAAITAPNEQLVPSLESARFNPRRWDPKIKGLFKAKPGQQRLQVVPSTLVRQLGYAVSNFCVAQGQLSKLFQLYERLFNLKEGALANLSDLQEQHSRLIRNVHNNPTNLELGSRAEQITRENMLFALDTVAPLLKPDRLAQWFEALASQAIAGYINLTPRELAGLNASLSGALEQTTAELRQGLANAVAEFELMQPNLITNGFLARYPGGQAISFQDKVNRLVEQLLQLHEELQLFDSQDADADAQIQARVKSLRTEVLDWPSKAQAPQVLQAHTKLAQYASEMLALRDQCLDSGPNRPSVEMVLTQYEQTLQGVLSSASIATEFGLKLWAQAVGAKT